MGTRMLQRRGTSAEWAAANPVLGDGEVGLDKTTGVFKIGDGTTAWGSLTNVYRRFVDSVAKAGDIMTGRLQVTDLGVASGTTLNVRQQGTATKANIDAARIDATSLYDTGNRVYSASNPDPIALLPDAKGDILAATAADTLARVPVGANGTVLAANSAAGAGVNWVAPFAVVDAKGDLIVATGSDAVTRVPVGNNDQVLVADSTQASGVRWATPATAVSFGFAEVFLHGGG